MKLSGTLILILMAIFIASCDRFEHTFKPSEITNAESVLFTPLREAFSQISSDDVSAVMDLYDDDYLHNNQSKTEREAFYLSLFEGRQDLNFTVTIIASQNIAVTDTTSLVSWMLQVKDQANNSIADSTFLGEYIIKRGSSWKLYGNRDYCCPPPEYKQRVFIEYFTGKFCPSCPQVATLLHQLQEAYPINLTYLAYHIADPMDIGNTDILTYYGNPPQPSVIFQGENKIIGNNADNEQIFNQLVAQIANTQADLILTNLDYTITNQLLSGTIRVNLLNDLLDSSKLHLKYAIIDKLSDAHTYLPSGTPCYNVVLAKGTKSLNGADLSQTVSFNLPFNSNLPIDSYLAIWVQVTPDPFENNAKIFNGIEAYLQVNKSHVKE